MSDEEMKAFTGDGSDKCPDLHDRIPVPETPDFCNVESILKMVSFTPSPVVVPIPSSPSEFHCPCPSSSNSKYKFKTSADCCDWTFEVDEPSCTPSLQVIPAGHTEGGSLDGDITVDPGGCPHIILNYAQSEKACTSITAKIVGTVSFTDIYGQTQTTAIEAKDDSGGGGNNNCAVEVDIGEIKLNSDPQVAQDGEDGGDGQDGKDGTTIPLKPPPGCWVEEDCETSSGNFASRGFEDMKVEECCECYFCNDPDKPGEIKELGCQSRENKECTRRGICYNLEECPDRDPNCDEAPLCKEVPEWAGGDKHDPTVEDVEESEEEGEKITPSCGGRTLIKRTWQIKLSNGETQDFGFEVDLGPIMENMITSLTMNGDGSLSYTTCAGNGKSVPSPFEYEDCDCES